MTLKGSPYQCFPVRVSSLLHNFLATKSVAFEGWGELFKLSLQWNLRQVESMFTVDEYTCEPITVQDLNVSHF